MSSAERTGAGHQQRRQQQQQQQQPPGAAAAALPDHAIKKIFDELDLDGSGTVSENEMAAVFGQLQLPFSKGDYERVLADHDTDGDGVLSLEEFAGLVRAGSAKRRELFDAIDTDDDGVWSPAEIRAAFGQYFQSERDLEAFVAQLMRTDLDNDGGISFEELSLLNNFERWAASRRANSLSVILDQYRADLDLGEDSTPPTQATTAHPVRRSPQTATQRAGIFAAGFMAGGLSRTATAPLERMKTLFQTGRVPKSMGFAPAVLETVRTQGVRSLWRGNLTNCLKVAPSKAVKFVMFESVRHAVSANPKRPTVSENFVASASVSAIVTACVHPMDTVKTRLAVSTEANPSIRSTVKAILGESGAEKRRLFCAMLH
jgi:solute carrier family 25 phosphate transporter 23/24/25/41